MKIILLRDLFGKERGEVLETVPCPISDIKFYFDLWVDGEKEPFRVLDGEFLLKEQDNSGKMFTKFLRKKFCLEGKEKAIIEFLKLDPKMNMDIHGEIFEKIINGDAEFINKNEDELELKEKEDLLYKAYLNNKFEKYFIFENNIYIPKYFITDLGDEDFDFNIDFSIDNCLNGKRASFYCKNRSDIIFQGIIEDVKTQIICEKVNVDKTYIKNSYKEVKYSYESMKAIGYSYYCEENDIEPSNKYRYVNKFAEKAEENETKELYENIKEEVLKKSPTFPVLINDVIYDIPEYPFKIWRHTLEKEDKSAFIKLYGEAISPSGIKLRNDDPYHNDWIIGAGINPDEYYSLAQEKGFRNFLYGTKNNYIYINQKTNENDFIVFTNQKEPELEDILNATDTGDIVVTTNISKTSHLVNNCKELDVSLIGCFYDLKNMIYAGQNGLCEEFSDKGIPLNQAKKGKAGQLALLKNNGFPVLDGIFFDKRPTFIKRKNMIFRSSGLEESDDLTASGLFKSIIGEGLETFDEVWNSFSSELAIKYLSKLNKKVSPGVLVQPYIEADESSVIKYNDGELNVSYIKGPCSKIVNGDKDVLHGERKETKDFLEMFKKIQEFTQENIEVEFLKKDEKIFILQLTKLK